MEQGKARDARAVHSSLRDPDLAEIVEMFVAELPARIAALAAAADANDWKEVARLAHQLKGAGGSYGFSELTPLAAGLESAAKGNSQTAEIPILIGDLQQLCRRLRA